MSRHSSTLIETSFFQPLYDFSSPNSGASDLLIRDVKNFFSHPDFKQMPQVSIQAMKKGKCYRLTVSIQRAACIAGMINLLELLKEHASLKNKPQLYCDAARTRQAQVISWLLLNTFFRPSDQDIATLSEEKITQCYQDGVKDAAKKVAASVVDSMEEPNKEINVLFISDFKIEFLEAYLDPEAIWKNIKNSDEKTISFEKIGKVYSVIKKRVEYISIKLQGANFLIGSDEYDISGRMKKFILTKFELFDGLLLQAFQQNFSNISAIECLLHCGARLTNQDTKYLAENDRLKFYDSALVALFNQIVACAGLFTDTQKQDIFSLIENRGEEFLETFFPNDKDYSAVGKYYGLKIRYNELSPVDFRILEYRPFRNSVIQFLSTAYLDMEEIKQEQTDISEISFKMIPLQERILFIKNALVSMDSKDSQDVSAESFQLLQLLRSVTPDVPADQSLDPSALKAGMFNRSFRQLSGAVIKAELMVERESADDESDLPPGIGGLSNSADSS